MNVFVDASVHKLGCNLGFFNASNGRFGRLPVRVKTSVDGEIVACLLALRYYKDESVIVHTDCQPALIHIHTKYPKYYDRLKWIPRGENKIADKLSKYNETIDNNVLLGKGGYDPKTKKFMDFRTYITDQPNSKKVNLYRKFAKTDHEKDLVNAIEKHYELNAKTPGATFQYKGKFQANTQLMKLIWNTNTHKTIGKGFFNFIKSRGQVMSKQETSESFHNLLENLKYSTRGQL